MTALRNQHGTALVAALSIAMILLPLGALVALQCRTDLTIQRNLRSDVETFYVAEAGLAHALADIPPGQSFDRLLAGPDHIAGTTDDGVFPFANGQPSAFPYAPYRYDVQVMAASPTLLRLVSTASGLNGSTKVVETLVRRAPLPFTPAALYAESRTPNVALGSSFQLSGSDHQAAFPPVPASPPTAPLPALSTPSTETEAMLRRMMASAAGQISGAGGAPSIATAARLDLDACAKTIATSPAATVRAAVPVEDAEWGTPAQPQVSIVAGDLRVAGHLTGNGVLVVRGTLDVTGTFEFSGVVLVQGAVLLEASSGATLIGTLWQAASLDERLELHGQGAIAYSSEALAVADRALPGVLPHAVAVAGWHEVL
jgi:hypothetical protein